MNELSILRSPNALQGEFFGLGRGVEALARLKILAVVVESLPTSFDVREVEIHNSFHGGMYARECHIPEGTFGVSAIHTFAHTSVLTKGKCLVADADGERIVEAGQKFESQAGAVRAVIAIEDTVWTNFYAGTGLKEGCTEDEIRATITSETLNHPNIPALLEGEN